MIADELRVFRASEYKIGPDIVMRQPSLDDIYEYGEQQYFGIVRTICATPADKKVEIWNALHIYWDEMDEFDLFISMIVSLRETDMSILFRDVDFASFVPMIHPKTNEVVLRNNDGVVIDRAIHALMTDYIRRVHRLKKNIDVGFDSITKDVMIEDDRAEQEALANKPFSSFLLPIISFLTNQQGFKYRFDDVWDLPVGVFLDSAERIQRTKRIDDIMHGVYSGCVDIKKINKKSLDYMRKCD